MINLENVSILGYNRANLFMGDSLRFSTKDTLQIQTSLYTLQNTSGVSGILNQLSGMSAGAEDWQPITLRGNYLGLAQINDVSFAAGVDVRLKNVNIDLTIYNSGNLFSLNTPDNLYSGVNFNNVNYPIHLIESLDEEFSCEVSDQGDFTEQQTIRVRMLSGSAISTTQNPLAMAKQLSANLILSNPQVGFINSQYSGYKQKPGKRSYTETQNLIDNSYSVTETFKLSHNFSGSYSVSYINSLNTNENGITIVSEKGKVQGLVPDSYGNYFEAAKSGGQYEVSNFSYLRCNNLFNTYKSSSNNYPLNTRKITYGQTLNKYTDNFEYNIAYSNDPKLSGSFTWEYTHNIEREPNNCTYIISEDGNILGYSADCTPINKYSNALAGYSDIKVGLYDRIYNVYTGFSTFANPIVLIEQGESKSQINGTIAYKRIYTDNLLYSYAGVRKMEISLDDNFSVPLKNNFNIANYKEIVQSANIPTLANRSVNLTIFGKRNMVLTGYLDIAKNKLNEYIPTVNAVDPYISNLGYSFSPLNNNFNCQCEWTYSQIIDLNQFLLT